jgi:hypothetical protein
LKTKLNYSITKDTNVVAVTAAVPADVDVNDEAEYDDDDDD